MNYIRQSGSGDIAILSYSAENGFDAEYVKEALYYMDPNGLAEVIAYRWANNLGVYYAPWK